MIASDDMIGKSGVWAHFGSWNFEKAIVWQTMRNLKENDSVEEMKGKFNYSDEKARALYSEMQIIKNSEDVDANANSWIAPWPSYGREGALGCSVLANPQNSQEKLVRCDNGLVVNLTDMNASFQVQGRIMHPVSLIYLSNETGTEQVVEKRFDSDIIPQGLSAILLPNGDSYASVIASPEIAGGMYTKMYFFGGKGLKHFKLLTHQGGFTSTNVFIYKADWSSLS